MLSTAFKPLFQKGLTCTVLCGVLVSATPVTALSVKQRLPIETPKSAPAQEEPPASTPQPPPAQTLTPMMVFEEHTELARIQGAATVDDRIQQLTEFQKQHPTSPLITGCKTMLARAYAERGEQALRSAQVAQAQEAFQLAVDSLPTPISTATFRSFLLSMPVLMAGFGNRTEAILFMRQLQERAGTEVELLEQIGLFYLSVENPTDALQVFDRAIELSPTQANFHYDRGVALQMGLRLTDARAAFQKAMELDPKSRTAPAALADLYRASGLLGDAEALYRQQVVTVPDHPSAWGGLTLALMEQRRYGDAAETLGKMLAYTPRDVRFLTQMAYVYAAQGEYASATKLLEKVREINPRYPWSRMVEAYLKRVEGDFADAENLLGEATDTARFPTLYFELGKTLVQANDYERAIEPFEAFLRMSPEGEFEATLGGVLEVRGSNLAALLETERQAAILMNDPLTSEAQFRQIEDFVRFAYLAKREAQANAEKNQTADATPPPASTSTEGDQTPSVRRPRRVVKPTAGDSTTTASWELPKPGDTPLGRALENFVSPKDDARGLRYLFAARKLVDANAELPQAEALARGAALFAGQATTREDAVADLPAGLSPEGRAQHFKLRAQAILGWILFREGKRDEAITALRTAAEGFPDGAEKKDASWKLGVVLEATGQLNDALVAYRSGYDSNSTTAAIHRAIIEGVYQKINGSLDGLDLK